jgi:UDP-N-acetylmuramate dehydrogenase
MVLPTCTADVVHAVQYCNETETRWLALGLGSNVLISDEGLQGVVIKLGKGMEMIVKEREERWMAGAGLPTPRLAKLTAAAGLSGMHRLIGVPGTVGGGVAMNAGAHGQSFGDVVRSVEVVHSDGGVHNLSGEDVPWQYRDSGLRDVIVTAAVFELTPEDPSVLKREIGRHLRWRKAGTPFDEPCCGSVFRNPRNSTEKAPDEPRTAGQLIDAVGLKGFSVGGAQVSRKHANYIVNTGNATSADVRVLIEAVQQRVMREFGVVLELEVRII